MRTTVLATFALLLSKLATAGLMVIDHPGPHGLDHALDAGISVVAEFEGHCLAIGTPAEIAAAAAPLGVEATLVDSGAGPWATVWLNDGTVFLKRSNLTPKIFFSGDDATTAHTPREAGKKLIPLDHANC